jgi:uncharacterized protein YbaP (TraB family)
MRAASLRPRGLRAAAAIGLLALSGASGAASTPPRAAAPALPYRLLPIDERVTTHGRVDGELVMVPDGDWDEESEIADEIMRTRESQPYRPKPALWRISDRDTTIYLFGTIHALPPGFRWRSARLDAAIAQADRLLLESTQGSVDDAGALLLGDVAPGAPELPPLTDRLPPENRGQLKAFEATLPQPAIKLLDGMPTWVAAMAISFVRDLRAGNRPGPGADDWLEARFRAAHKPIAGIEDSAKVVANVNAVPEVQQRAMLVAALDAPARSGDAVDAPAHAWAQGDIGPKSALVAELDGEGSAVLRGPLLTERNRAWADSLAKRLQRPGVELFAAGAGHFIGRDSVIELLRKRGIKVTRVE